jgi:hypothetical protein
LTVEVVCLVVDGRAAVPACTADDAGDCGIGADAAPSCALARAGISASQNKA